MAACRSLDYRRPFQREIGSQWKVPNSMEELRKHCFGVSTGVQDRRQTFHSPPRTKTVVTEVGGTIPYQGCYLYYMIQSEIHAQQNLPEEYSKRQLLLWTPYTSTYNIRSHPVRYRRGWFLQVPKSIWERLADVLAPRRFDACIVKDRVQMGGGEKFTCDTVNDMLQLHGRYEDWLHNHVHEFRCSSGHCEPFGLGIRVTVIVLHPECQG